MRRAILVFVCCLTVLFTGLILYDHAEAASGRGKSVSGNLLPMELKDLNIKDDFIPYDGKEAGVIKTVVGHVVVTRENMRQAYYGVEGDQLYEKDVLFTLKESRCRFKLHNEDTVTMGENARVGITAFADDRKTREKRSAFDMAKGKAMFYTLRLLKHKQADMDVTTPTATIGVRGTKFGAEIVEIDGSTNVYAFEGAIAVTATATGQTTTLNEGQGVNANIVGLGGTFETPPESAKQFIMDTSIPGIQDQGSTSTGTVRAIGATRTDEKASTDTSMTLVAPDSSTLVQTQNFNQLQQTRPLTHFGYAIGVISEYYAPPTPARSFPHNYHESLTNFDPSYSVSSESGVSAMTIEGLAGGSAMLTNLTIKQTSPPAYIVMNTGLPAPVSHAELGYDSYTEWGYWMQPNAMSNDALSTIYRFDNKNYYIWGDPTPNNQMAALSANNVTGIYSGVAYGTYAGGMGPAPVTADMSGSFSTVINFGPKTVSNFNVNVSGGGHSMTITGASGNFPGVDSQFTVNPSSGQWRLDGLPPYMNMNGANGSVFGSNGQAVGGQWLILTGSNDGPAAHGIFQGRR